MDDKSLESGWVARWIALLVLLLIPHFAFAACADEAKSIKEAVDEWAGDSALLKAQYDKASALLQKDDKCALAMAQLSRIVRKAGFLKGSQFRSENLAKAKTLALQAVQLDPDCYLCQWELAHVYMFQSDVSGFDATLAQVRKAEKTPQDHVCTQILEANFQNVVKKDYAKAAQLAEAIQGDDEAYIHLYKLEIQKTAYPQIGKLELADATYQEQIKLQPTAWVYGDYAAFLTGSLKQHDKAIIYARKSLALMDYPLGHVKLSTALSNKAYDLIKAGDLKGSIPLNEEAYKENHDNHFASNNLGYVYREMALKGADSWEKHMEYKEKSVDWYGKTLSSDPKNDYARRELEGIKLWKVK
ncbi:MAG: hypothetical protein HPY82_17695 [Gammaproteobacteria bacterium]|nr:hypothetical protein [Gammaproteobacteria bacterium]